MNENIYPQMMKYTERMELIVGDELLILPAGAEEMSETERVTVERVTKTQVVLSDGKRYKKDTGREIAPTHGTYVRLIIKRAPAVETVVETETEIAAETVETETVAVTAVRAGQTVILDNGDRAEITGTAISSTGRMSLTFRRNGDFVTDSQMFDRTARVTPVPADEPVAHRDGTVTENGVLIGTVGRSWRTSYKAGVWVASGFGLMGKTQNLSGSWETRAEAVAALVKHAHRYDAIEAAKNERISAARAARAAA